jgi:hypothetical protein
MRRELLLIMLAAAGASEQEIRVVRGAKPSHNAASDTRPPPARPQGPAALLAFRDRCVSTTLGDDELSVCPFANVTQTSLSGEEFVLGVFKAWRGRSLVYSGGDACEESGPRNATVTVWCGAAAYGLRDAREPTTCNYEVLLDVPVACEVLGLRGGDGAELAALRAELAAAEAAALAAVDRAGDLAARLERAQCATAADLDDPACDRYASDDAELGDYDDEDPYDTDDGPYDDPYAAGEL